MIAQQTEALHQEAQGLDSRPLPDVAAILIESQITASQTVLSAIPNLAAAASRMAETLSAGGVLHYVAAGSSGLMAAADAQELGGTFLVPASQIKIHMAGGLPTGAEMPGDTEDEPHKLASGLSRLSAGDTVIAVSASGTTPYTLSAARTAREKGAILIAVANNEDTPLLNEADIAICLATPPEVLSGSTRLGAGTAQKIALNAMSTLMAIRLGHVHDGMMVNVRADNAKLRARAESIVAHIADVSVDAAKEALGKSNGGVKLAVLLARGQTAEAATTLLAETKANLRLALARL